MCPLAVVDRFRREEDITMSWPVYISPRLGAIVCESASLGWISRHNWQIRIYTDRHGGMSFGRAHRTIDGMQDTC